MNSGIYSSDQGHIWQPHIIWMMMILISVFIHYWVSSKKTFLYCFLTRTLAWSSIDLKKNFQYLCSTIFSTPKQHNEDGILYETGAISYTLYNPERYRSCTGGRFGCVCPDWWDTLMGAYWEREWVLISPILLLPNYFKENKQRVELKEPDLKYEYGVPASIAAPILVEKIKELMVKYPWIILQTKNMFKCDRRERTGQHNKTTCLIIKSIP